ncbi:MAG: HutD family protein [Burkholderiaceae bacterium]
MSATPERFDLCSITPQPWKNGAGITREIAIGPKGAGASDFDWRFSLAEVERDAPFSAFPGVDRCIVLLRGAGMRLRSDGGELDHRLDRQLVPFHFSGDTPLSATLIDGPSSDFNVMTRRGGWTSEVTTHHHRFEPAEADVTLLLCNEGEWLVASASQRSLGPMQALLWRGPSPRISVSPQSAGALLLVRLCHDQSP